MIVLTNPIGNGTYIHQYMSIYKDGDEAITPGDPVPDHQAISKIMVPLGLPTTNIMAST